VPPELMLKLAQQPLAFCDLSQQGSGLGDEQVLVVGDQDGALGVGDRAYGAIP